MPPRGARGVRRSDATASTYSNSRLSFQGGGPVNGRAVIEGEPRVYIVYWGSQWGNESTNSAGNHVFSGDPDGLAPHQQALFKGLGTDGDAWSGVMTQYCDSVASGATSCPASNQDHVGYPAGGGGVLAGVWYDNSTPAPSVATDAEIAQEAINAAQHFGNTSAGSNLDNQYIITSPTGVDPGGCFVNANGNSSGCSTYCAWHSDTTALPWNGDDVAYTNMPYIPDAGTPCGVGAVNTPGTVDGVSIVGGHEYAETLTDAFGQGGWCGTNGCSSDENADKCEWGANNSALADVTFSTGTFAMQPTWANDGGGNGACEISHSAVVNASVPPPAEPLSNYEHSTGDTVDRDCGFSAPVTGPDSTTTQDLWLFCDSIDYTPDGTIKSAILGTDSGAEAPLAAGRVPQSLTEVTTPSSTLTLPSNRAPEPFLPVPTGLTLPGSTSSCASSPPSNGDGVYGSEAVNIYPASWLTGITDNNSPGVNQVLMAYNNYCVDDEEPIDLLFTDEDFGLVAYDPTANTLSQPVNVFATTGGTNLPQAEQLGSPVVSGGYLYLFNADCTLKAYATCGSGNVYMARVPLAGFTDPSQYRWWTGSTWSSSFIDAGNLIPGATALTVSAGNYSSTGHGFVMVDETNLAGGFQVWTATALTGPWTLLQTDTVPSSCQGGSFGCYAVNGHPELSTSNNLMISYFDPAGDGHLHLAAFPWGVSNAASASPSAAPARRAGTAWPAAGEAAPGKASRAP